MMQVSIKVALLLLVLTEPASTQYHQEAMLRKFGGNHAGSSAAVDELGQTFSSGGTKAAMNEDVAFAKIAKHGEQNTATVTDQIAQMAHEKTEVAHEERAELGSDDDGDAHAVFMYPHEKASDPHTNEKGFETIVQVEKVCDDCDIACQTVQNEAIFVACKSKNQSLSVQDIHDCMFDGGVVGQGEKKVNASDAVVSRAKAEKFVNDHDADGSGDLNQTEFLHSQNPPPAYCKKKQESDPSFLADDKTLCNPLARLFDENAPICPVLEESSTTEQGNCVTKTIDKVVEVVESSCTYNFNVKECWESWAFWRGTFWTCKWNTIVVTVECWIDKLVTIVNSVISGFEECWQDVINEVKKLVGGDAIDALGSCNSVTDCLEKLLAIPAALITHLIGIIVDSIGDLLGDDFQRGKEMVTNALNDIPGIANDADGIFAGFGDAVEEMQDGNLLENVKVAEWDMCPPVDVGIWKFEGTDCGALGRLGDLFDISNVFVTPWIFGDVIAKFGQCISQTAFFGVPTPFLNLHIIPVCVPDQFQSPLNSIVDSFRFLIGINSVASCGYMYSDPVCTLIQGIKSLNQRMRQAFSTSLLQQSAEAVGSTLHGDQAETSIYIGHECSGPDWLLFFDISGAISDITVVGSKTSVAIGVQFRVGCRYSEMYLDAFFIFSLTSCVVALRTSCFGSPQTFAMSIGYTIGFAVGTFAEEIVVWFGRIKFTLSTAGLGTSATFAMALVLLPQLSYPTGFEVKPAWMDKGISLLGEQARQQEIDDPVQKAETIEDKVYSATGTLLKHSRILDVTELVQATEYMSAMRKGQFTPPFIASLAAGRSNLVIAASLKVDFCLTCFLNEAAKRAAGAGDPAYSSGGFGMIGGGIVPECFSNDQCAFDEFCDHGACEYCDSEECGI